jgi:hypothetical protein
MSHVHKTKQKTERNIWNSKLLSKQWTLGSMNMYVRRVKFCNGWGILFSVFLQKRHNVLCSTYRGISIMIQLIFFDAVFQKLTSWSRVFLEMLTVVPLVKKFPFFYETWRFKSCSQEASSVSVCSQKCKISIKGTLIQTNPAFSDTDHCNIYLWLYLLRPSHFTDENGDRWHSKLLSRIWDTHGGEYEDGCLLVCSAG